MNYCPNCGNKITHNSKYCSGCGKEITQVNTSAPTIELKTETKPKNEKKVNKILKQVTAIFVFLLVLGISRSLSESLFKDGVNGTANNVKNYFSGSEWKEFTSTEGKFKINFPTYPKTERSKKSLEGIDLSFTHYESETSNGDAFIASFTIYPQSVDTSDPKTNLEGSVNGVVASRSGNKLISSNLTSYSGDQAVDYVVQTKEGYYMNGRNILADKTLYSLIAASEKSGIPNGYQNFLNSFQTIK